MFVTVNEPAIAEVAPQLTVPKLITDGESEKAAPESLLGAAVVTEVGVESSPEPLLAPLLPLLPALPLAPLLPLVPP